MKKGLLSLGLMVVTIFLAHQGWTEEKTDNSEKLKSPSSKNIGFSCPGYGMGLQSVALTLRSWKENEGTEWNLYVLGFSKKKYNFLNLFEIPSGSKGAVIRWSILGRYLSISKGNLYPYLSAGVISGVWQKGEWKNITEVAGLSAGVGISCGIFSLELGYGTYVFYYKESKEAGRSSYFALTALF